MVERSRSDRRIGAVIGAARWCAAAVLTLGCAASSRDASVPGAELQPGPTLVNVFGWGIGGTVVTDSPYRVMTEAPDSVSAYRKMLDQR